jgi:hypothetical protein
LNVALTVGTDRRFPSDGVLQYDLLIWGRIEEVLAGLLKLNRGIWIELIPQSGCEAIPIWFRSRIVRRVRRMAFVKATSLQSVLEPGKHKKEFQKQLLVDGSVHGSSVTLGTHND